MPKIEYREQSDWGQSDWGQSDWGQSDRGQSNRGTKWPGDKVTGDKVTGGQSDLRTKWPRNKVTGDKVTGDKVTRVSDTIKKVIRKSELSPVFLMHYFVIKNFKNTFFQDWSQLGKKTCKSTFFKNSRHIYLPDLKCWICHRCHSCSLKGSRYMTFQTPATTHDIYPTVVPVFWNLPYRIGLLRYSRISLDRFREWIAHALG
jgi:hypothetical protein